MAALFLSAFLAALLGFTRSDHASVDEDPFLGVLVANQAWEATCGLLLSPVLTNFKPDFVNAEVHKAGKQELLLLEERFTTEGGVDGLESFLSTHVSQPLTTAVETTLAQMPISRNLCDPRHFAMLIDSHDEPVSCDQVCMHCLPGSVPLCYAKNRHFPGIARTCLCTYDTTDPLHKAAFALKSSPVPPQFDNRPQGKSKRELYLTKMAKTILFL